MTRSDAMAATAALRGLGAPARPFGSGRRIYPLSRHWALAVNQKLLAALGLAVLGWVPLAALILAAMR
jgi:hypothetical protein